MAERKRVALSYSYNEGWIGGTYYIENLVSALNTLPAPQKPHIVLLTNTPNDLKIAKKKLIYPHISYQLASGESNSFFRFVNKVTGRLVKKRLFPQAIKNLDAVFPFYDCVQQSLAKKKIYWIADFQEHFATDFFDKQAVAARKEVQEIIQASANYLILSSNNALQHFKLLYPNYKVKTSVLPFAVTHPKYQQLDMVTLLARHGLPEHYLICPNQFWKHKNQLTVLKAVNQLKKQGVNVVVAFTGNTRDYRNPDYFPGLQQYVKENQLDDNIRFLGFIDRLEQLQLMAKSAAIIQPSLFEGWSTVVEDAKAMNKFLIVSNIEIHREQLVNSSAMFFDPLNEQQLADILSKVNNQTTVPELFQQYNYQENIKTFGRDFLTIIS
jgi:glycosyltransferase involved in cell wall biosynthesis